MIKTIKNFKKILSDKDFNYLYIIFFLMVINGFIEALSIGILIPLLSVFFIETANSTISNFLLGFLDFFNLENSVLILLVIIISIYIFKYLYLIFFTAVQSKYLLNLNSKLKTKMFRGYIDQPLTFHTNTNSSFLISTIDKETGIFINSYLSSSLMLMMNCLTSIFIVTLLLIVNFKVTLAILLIFLLFLILSNKIFSSKLKKIGLERQTNERLYMKYLRQGLDGIIEIKMHNLKDNVINSFFFHLNKIVKIGVIRSIIGILPKVLFEFIFVSMVVVIIAYTYYSGNSLDRIFTTLIIYATAAFRLMPAMNAISYNYQKRKFASAALNNIIATFNDFKITDDGSMVSESKENQIKFNKHIKIKDLNFSYPKTKYSIIKNLDIHINKFDTIGLIGSNGSGKTTLLSIICGLLKPSRGSIEIDGMNINKNINFWKKKIGYIPQTIYLFDESLSKNICLSQKMDENKINKIIKKCQLENLVLKLPQGLNTSIGERGAKLSGGEKQKIAIARALYRDPEILIFDEFTSAMDTQTESDFVEEINSKYNEKTVIIVSHRESALKYCNKIYNMDNKVLSTIKE